MITDIISFVFAFLHIVTYVMVIYWAYTRYIFPFLLRQRHDESAYNLQIQQKKSIAQDALASFFQRYQYIRELFQKFSEQYMRSEIIIKKRKAHEQQLDFIIQNNAVRKQEKIDYTRHTKNIYHDLAPEVIQRLRTEMVDHCKQAGNRYLDDALKKLKQQADGRDGS